MEDYTETTPKESPAYSELTPKERKLLQKCYSSTLVSPLEFCRIMQETAPARDYFALKNVEIYLINE